MVVEGKVTGITKFGAFVTMPDGKSGLVHISEIANTFVNDVHDYVQEGQTVKVRVLSIADDGKINLSIKKAEEPAPGARPERRAPRAPSAAPRQHMGGGRQGDQSFEDKLKHFMQESDSRMADNKMYSDHRTSRRRK